jgi:hypothetical protein
MHATVCMCQGQYAWPWLVFGCYSTSVLDAILPGSCTVYCALVLLMDTQEATHPPQAAFVEQLRARHATSKQPESQAIVAVLSAIVDVLSSQRLQPTPVSVFAAVVSSLSTGGSQTDPQVSTASRQSCRHL